MADRSISDIIKFIDSTNSIDDATVAEISRKLKFTEVMDLISAIKSQDIDTAKTILSKYDPIFNQAATVKQTQETTIKPVGSTTTTMGTSSFPKVAPKGNLPSTSNAPSAAGEEQDLNQLVNDPTKQNDPNVRQLKTLLQKMGVQ